MTDKMAHRGGTFLSAPNVTLYFEVRDARRSPAQGAETIIWLATLPKSGPSGKFFKDRKRLDW